MIQYGELSICIVFSKMNETDMLINPIMEIVFAPYRSYKFPETIWVIDTRIVPGTRTNPDKKAFVPSTSWANIVKIVSADKISIKLMNTRIMMMLNVLL